MGLSQADLGTLLGGSTRAVEDWEAGRRRPPAMLPLALAAIWEGLPSGIQALANRNLTRSMLQSAAGALLTQMTPDPTTMTDDERYDWALNARHAAMSFAGAMATHNMTSEYPRGGNLSPSPSQWPMPLAVAPPRYG